MSGFRHDKAIKFLRIARFNALEFSKDPSTQVGCVLVNPLSGAVLSTGYNGMPPGCDDNKPERLQRPEKYLWFTHAEANALLTAADEGIRVNNCVAMVTMIPCMDCARSLARVKCKQVFTCVPDSQLMDRWGDHFSRTQELFDELGIELIVFPLSEIESVDKVPSKNLGLGWSMGMNQALSRK